MRNILLFIIIAILLSGCISTKQRARNLVRRGYEKIQKGIRLDPSVADSVNRLMTVYVTFPEDSGKFDPKLVVDSSAFYNFFSSYDSLVLVSDSLKTEVDQSTLTRAGLERYIGDLKRTNDALLKARNRTIPAFVKDSTYHYSDTSVVLSFDIKKGVLSGLKYKVKEKTASKTVATSSVTLDGARSCQPWSQTWFWIMLCLILLLVLIIIVRIIR